VLRLSTRSDLSTPLPEWPADASLKAVVDAASWAFRDTAAGVGMAVPTPVLPASRKSEDLGARLDLSPFDAVTEAVGREPVGDTIGVAWSGPLALAPRRREVPTSRPAFRTPSGVASTQGDFTAAFVHDASDGLPVSGRAGARMRVRAGTHEFRVTLGATFERVAFPEPAIAGLVEIGEGTLPLIVSAPHGGRSEIQTPERTGQGVDRFVTVLDGNTYEVARGVVDGLERKTRGQAVVRAREGGPQVRRRESGGRQCLRNGRGPRVLRDVSRRRVDGFEDDPEDVVDGDDVRHPRPRDACGHDLSAARRTA
jgi:hypothetical protein